MCVNNEIETVVLKKQLTKLHSALKAQNFRQTVPSEWAE